MELRRTISCKRQAVSVDIYFAMLSKRAVYLFPTGFFKGAGDVWSDFGVLVRILLYNVSFTVLRHWMSFFLRYDIAVTRTEK